MIEKIQDKIDKYVALRSVEDVYLSQSASVTKFNLIGDFLRDLNHLLESAKEKKKACCEKKTGKQFAVTTCRNCPHLVTNSALFAKYCGHLEEIGERDIINQDTLPDWCPL